MLLGLHHVTALAGDPQRNFEFYCGFMGMRLVKRTVNFDEPAAYHFYFSSGDATPGSLLTFFPRVNGRPGHAGSGQISSVGLGVDSLDAWNRQAQRAGVKHRREDKTLTLFDPDGIAIVLTEGAGRLTSVALRVRDTAATGEFLRDALGLTPLHDESGRFVIGDSGNSVEVIGAAEDSRGKMAAGIIHHVAFRVDDEEDQLQWRQKLIRLGLHVSPVKDRLYFHSIYFREPGGILFEIATGGPGFQIDEAADRLGERLSLPPWLEPVRESIERRLPPLHFLCPSQQSS
jgi:catechol 2,3-dioxygenase-like lactoylglutathione lyase family enzyme